MVESRVSKTARRGAPVIFQHVVPSWKEHKDRSSSRSGAKVEIGFFDFQGAGLAPAFAPLTSSSRQEVVHSIGTREADCDEQSSFRGQTEWTSTRMPDSLCAVERL